MSRMRSTLLLLGAALVACGSEAHPASAPAIAFVGCAAGATTARPLPPGTVVRGPLALVSLAFSRPVRERERPGVAGALRLPFGVRSCAPRAVAPATILRRAPYTGVACPRANSIACDRVGLAVWLGEPAAVVSARLDGSPVVLGAAHLGGRPATDWIGYLRPAGLLDGALRITPDRGRTHWEGAHPKRVRLVIDVLRRDGSAVRTQTTVPLSPGWG